MAIDHGWDAPGTVDFEVRHPSRGDSVAGCLPLFITHRLMGLMEMAAVLPKCLLFPHLLCMTTELSHVVTVRLLFPVQINEYSFGC